jgi:thiol:disulfide interchange protein DsbD
MEAEVFDTDQVRSYLKDNFVVVKLMVDDRAKLFTPITVDIDGKVTTLETVGEKWSYLQMHKFGANSQPYYIVLDNEGRPMNDPVYYDNNIDSFMNWLETGLNNYKTQK